MLFRSGLTVTSAEVKSAIWKVWGPLEGCAHVEASKSMESYRSWIGKIEREILIGLGIDGPWLDGVIRRVMELQVDPASYRAYRDTRPALRSLSQRGLRLGIISNFAWELPELVAGLGLAEYFDLILTSARLGYRKPRPEIFRRALSQAGVDPGRALYVGDDPWCDRDGASAAGMPSLLIDRSRPASTQQRRIQSLARVADYLDLPT